LKNIIMNKLFLLFFTTLIRFSAYAQMYIVEPNEIELKLYDQEIISSNYGFVFYGTDDNNSTRLFLYNNDQEINSLFSFGISSYIYFEKDNELIIGLELAERGLKDAVYIYSLKEDSFEPYHGTSESNLSVQPVYDGFHYEYWVKGD
jgi:hypothetical protein